MVKNEILDLILTPLAQIWNDLIGRCPNNAERPKSLKLDGTFLSFAISFEISSLTQNHLLDENYLPLQQTHISVLS